MRKTLDLASPENIEVGLHELRQVLRSFKVEKNHLVGRLHVEDHSCFSDFPCETYLTNSILNTVISVGQFF